MGSDETARLRSALEDMVYQFAYASSKDGIAVLLTGGLGALEVAFEALGWEDPHPTPERQCDEPGCCWPATCGWPTNEPDASHPSGRRYRRTCEAHWNWRREEEEGR